MQFCRWIGESKQDNNNWGNIKIVETLNNAFEMLEDIKRKNNKTQKKLNTKRFYEKIKLSCLIASIMLNVYFEMKLK